MKFRVLLAFACLAAVLTAAAATVTAVQAADPVDIEAARREKSVSWYTSTPVAQAQQLASTFEQQTGIKVQLLRSGGQAVLRRLQQELSAGRPGADVLTMSDAGAANGLAKQGILEPFRPEGFDKVVDDAKDRDGRWIAQRLQLVGIPIRTDKVPPADRPRTWSDLADPKYKGRMVMPDPSFTAIQLVVVGMLSQRLGWDFYKALRGNETMIVQGHQQVFSTMQQGERLMGRKAPIRAAFLTARKFPTSPSSIPKRGHSSSRLRRPC